MDLVIDFLLDLGLAGAAGLAFLRPAEAEYTRGLLPSAMAAWAAASRATGTRNGLHET